MKKKDGKTTFFMYFFVIFRNLNTFNAKNFFKICNFLLKFQ